MSQKRTTINKAKKMQLNSSSPEHCVLLYLFDIIKSFNPPGVKLAGLYVLKEILHSTVSPMVVDFCCERGLLPVLMDICNKEFDQFDEHNDILLYRVSAEILWIISYLPLQKYKVFSSHNFTHHLIDFLNVKTKFYQFSPRFVQTLGIFQNKYFVQKKIQVVTSTSKILEDLKYYSGGMVQNCEISEVFMVNPSLFSPKSKTVTTHLSTVLIEEGLAWPVCVQNQSRGTAASESATMKLPLASSKDNLQALMATKHLSSPNPPSGGEFSEVMGVYMLRTIGGNYFWGHLGEKSRELVNSLSHYLQKLLPMLTQVTPKIGEIVIVTLDITDVNMHSIVRARVLDVCDEKIKVLAIDSGFITTVDACQIFGLDRYTEVVSFPPQAHVFCLSGVQAPPADEAAVELVLATLINMTKASVRTGIMLLEDGGIDHLLSLLCCGRPAILVQVGCLISILAKHSSLHRKKDLGVFIKPVLDVLRGSKPKRLLPYKVVVGCLYALGNIIVFSQAMRNHFFKCEGQLAVLKLMVMYKYVPAVVQNCASLLNVCYPGLTGPVSSKAVEAFVSLQLGDSSDKEDVQLTTKASSRADVPKRKLRKFAEEKAELQTQPLMQHAGEDLSCDKKEGKGYSSKRCSGEKEEHLAPASMEGKIMPVDSGSPCGTSERFIELESYLPHKDDLTHHIIEGQRLCHISFSMVAEIVCGMLNSGHGGCIYFGLTKEGYVKGIMLNRDDRDRLHLAIDDLMDKTFTTPILPTLFDVIYTPVSQRLCTGHLVPCVDLFMVDFDGILRVEIIIKSNKDTVYITFSGKCFYRVGPNTVELTVHKRYRTADDLEENFIWQEVRHLWVLEEDKYEDEILLHEIWKLQDPRIGLV